MFEDFLPPKCKKYKPPVLNVTTTKQPTTGASDPLDQTDQPTQNPPTLHTLVTDMMDSPYSNVMDSPKSAPAEPFEWNSIWQEIKITIMWLIILTNVSLISYQLGKRTVTSTTRRRRTLRPLPSAFELQTMTRPTQRHAEDDGFNNVDLGAYEHYESVISLPLPDPPTTRM